MDGGKLLKLLISFLIALQIIGFVFGIPFLNPYCKFLLYISIIVLYVLSSKKVRVLHVIVLFVFFVSELIYLIDDVLKIKYQMQINILGYILLLYYLYANHKSFMYNRRDVLTLVMGSSLYTIIFFITYSAIRSQMGDLYLIGFLHMLLLYILLIVGAMHYINIRSEKSMWFFLGMLNFAFSDFILLIDHFYLKSNELKVIRLICAPLAFIFLVNYMITKYESLKAEEFEGF